MFNFLINHCNKWYFNLSVDGNAVSQGGAVHICRSLWFEL